MKTYNQKTMTRGALLVGPVVPTRKLVTGETLGVTGHDTERFLDLGRSFRVRRHEDGWFVDGSGHKAQIWQFAGFNLSALVMTKRTFAVLGTLNTSVAFRSLVQLQTRRTHHNP